MKSRKGFKNCTLAVLLLGMNTIVMTSCGGQKKEKAAAVNDSLTVVQKPESVEQPSGDTLSVAIVGKLKKGRGFLLEVKKGGKEVQQLDYRYSFDDYGEPNMPIKKDSVLLRDVTSDGYKDLLVYVGSYGNQGIERFDCYVWDKKIQKLVHASSFVDIDNPEVDEVKGYVFSSARSSATEYIYGKWKYEDGEFKKIAELIQRHSLPNGDIKYTEMDLDKKVCKKNPLKEELRESWPPSLIK